MSILQQALETLKEVQVLLNAKPRFKAGGKDSYDVAAKVDRAVERIERFGITE